MVNEMDKKKKGQESNAGENPLGVGLVRQGRGSCSTRVVVRESCPSLQLRKSRDWRYDVARAQNE